MSEKIYFIYNFSNKDNALVVINKLKDEGYELFYFDPEKKNRFWKSKARKEMKKCSRVVSYVYKNAITEDNENLNYELNLAKKYHKDVKEEKCEDWNELLQDSLSKQTNANILLKEYELMLKTTETIEDLRQKTSNFYVTIMAALFAIVGSSFALKEFLITFIIMAVLGVFMTLLTLNWWQSIKCYHHMNYVKFEVIDELEKRLALKSFKAEYSLKKAERLPSFKKREQFLITIFCVISLLMIVCGFVGALIIYFH